MNLQPSRSLPRVRWRTFVAACALLAASPGWAASSGTTTLGPIRVELIDLRPDDGIAPAIAFQLQGFEAGVAASAGVTLPLDFELRARYGPWQGTNIDAASPYSWTTVAVFGGAPDSPNGVAATLVGSALDYVGATGSGAAFAAEMALLTNGASIGFELSPWTRVVLSMDFSTQLATTKDEDSALTTIEMFLSDDAGTLPATDRFDLGCTGLCSASEQRTMSVALANTSSQGMAGNWWAGANLGGTSFASAVPEPGPASLFLGGVGLLGWMARRRAPRR